MCGFRDVQVIGQTDTDCNTLHPYQGKVNSSAFYTANVHDVTTVNIGIMIKWICNAIVKDSLVVSLEKLGVDNIISSKTGRDGMQILRKDENGWMKTCIGY